MFWQRITWATFNVSLNQDYTTPKHNGVDGSDWHTMIKRDSQCIFQYVTFLPFADDIRESSPSSSSPTPLNEIKRIKLHKWTFLWFPLCNLCQLCLPVIVYLFLAIAHCSQFAVGRICTRNALCLCKSTVYYVQCPMSKHAHYCIAFSGNAAIRSRWTPKNHVTFSLIS